MGKFCMPLQVFENVVGTEARCGGVGATRGPAGLFYVGHYRVKKLGFGGYQLQNGSRSGRMLLSNA